MSERVIRSLADAEAWSQEIFDGLPKGDPEHDHIELDAFLVAVLFAITHSEDPSEMRILARLALTTEAAVPVKWCA